MKGLRSLGLSSCSALIGLVLLASTASADLLLTQAGGKLLANGQPLRMVGYSDLGILAERDFDYVAFFDHSLVPKHLNYIRVWLCYPYANDLTPFVGSRPTGFHLLQRNQTLMTRLVALVQAANARNIVVHLTLFDGCQFDSGARDPHHVRWVNNPYNDARNSEPYLTKPSQFDDVGTPCWNQVNVPLIQDVADRLGNFGNVIYEVLNEPNVHGGDNDNLAFQKAVVTVLRTRLNLYGGSKMISINLPGDAATKAWALSDSRVSLVAMHLGPTESPHSSWATLPKPVLVSNDGHNTQSKTLLSNPSQRPSMTNSLCAGTFQNGQPLGRFHFDFLDKGLNGSSWRTQNYNPRAALADAAIVSVLAHWTATH
ncbi:MAG: hypothetical protein HYZ53_30705 [Planctomycetes bacterium]|nr:hypothetical protein [Planctomycetota bacterium]